MDKINKSGHAEQWIQTCSNQQHVYTFHHVIVGQDRYCNAKVTEPNDIAWWTCLFYKDENHYSIIIIIIIMYCTYRQCSTETVRYNRMIWKDQMRYGQVDIQKLHVAVQSNA